jgi:hypothetical protein
MARHGGAGGSLRGRPDLPMGRAMSGDVRQAQRYLEEAVNELHGLPDPDGVLADARALLAKASVNLRSYRVPEPAAS